MKVVICGGRDYQFTQADKNRLYGLKKSIPITEVISGGARGADRCGEDWARSQGLSVKVFEADWEKHGRFAGPLRNDVMAQYCDAVVVFPGGAGTANMVSKAYLHQKKLYDLRTKHAKPKLTVITGGRA